MSQQPAPPPRDAIVRSPPARHHPHLQTIPTTHYRDPDIAEAIQTRLLPSTCDVGVATALTTAAQRADFGDCGHRRCCHLRSAGPRNSMEAESVAGTGLGGLHAALHTHVKDDPPAHQHTSMMLGSAETVGSRRRAHVACSDINALALSGFSYSDH